MPRPSTSRVLGDQRPHGREFTYLPARPMAAIAPERARNTVESRGKLAESGIVATYPRCARLQTPPAPKRLPRNCRFKPIYWPADAMRQTAIGALQNGGRHARGVSVSRDFLRRRTSQSHFSVRGYVLESSIVVARAFRDGNVRASVSRRLLLG